MTKTKRLSIKLLPSDKAALERLSLIEGESLAVIVRRLIRREAARLPDASPPSAQPAQPAKAQPADVQP